MADTYQKTTLTAFYDERDDAEEAVSKLRELGIGEASIRIVGGDQANRDDDKGFWESLADFFFPEDDRAMYAEGLRRGGYLVTVNGLTSNTYDRALDILDDEGTVDIDERAQKWRTEGWTGYSSSSTSGESRVGEGYAGGSLSSGYGQSRASEVGSGIGSGVSSPGTSAAEQSLGATGVAGSSGSSFGASATSSSSYGATASDTTLRGDEEVIPVVEEELRIGKRDVNLGRVRVRSYVVEEPVSESVNLREERVHVERRPVDRPVEAGDRLFTDRVIEAEEHAEEAVVAKEARVREEIALRKEAEQRTETVSDTVRRTEVEIEDDRSAVDIDSTVERSSDTSRR